MYILDIPKRWKVFCLELTKGENVMTDDGGMALAIQKLQAGTCNHCQGIRIPIEVPTGGGSWGAPITNKTIFVCGTQGCPNEGKL